MSPDGVTRFCLGTVTPFQCFRLIQTSSDFLLAGASTFAGHPQPEEKHQGSNRSHRA